jgi:uncharacterized protein YcbX
MSNHPVVDAPAAEHPEAAPYHHRWFLVDAQCQQLGRSKAPDLAKLSVNIAHDCLVLKAPGMLRLDIVLEVIEDDDSVRWQAWVGDQAIDVVDEGDLVAAWFSNLLGQACRLVKVHPEATPPH